MKGKKMSNIANTLLDNHFGTSVRTVECKHFDNGVYQFSTFHHTHHLAWGAGENWKMLRKTHGYTIPDGTDNAVR